MCQLAVVDFKMNFTAQISKQVSMTTMITIGYLNQLKHCKIQPS